MPDIGPQTYNDDRISEISRRVFYKALSEAEKVMDEKGSPERLHALAATADAAASGFAPEEEDEL